MDDVSHVKGIKSVWVVMRRRDRSPEWKCVVTRPWSKVDPP
jgi:hypothetical protein